MVLTEIYLKVSITRNTHHHRSVPSWKRGLAVKKKSLEEEEEEEEETL